MTRTTSKHQKAASGPSGWQSTFRSVMDCLWQLLITKTLSFFSYFWGQGLMHSDWPQTRYVTQAGLELSIPPDLLLTSAGITGSIRLPCLAKKLITKYLGLQKSYFDSTLHSSDYVRRILFSSKDQNLQLMPKHAMKSCKGIKLISTRDWMKAEEGKAGSAEKRRLP